MSSSDLQQSNTSSAAPNIGQLVLDGSNVDSIRAIGGAFRCGAGFRPAGGSRLRLRRSWQPLPVLGDDLRMLLSRGQVRVLPRIVVVIVQLFFVRAPFRVTPTLGSQRVIVLPVRG